MLVINGYSKRHLKEATKSFYLDAVLRGIIITLYIFYYESLDS